MSKRYALSNMRYDEVAFVDRGANLDLDGETGAHIVIFKSEYGDMKDTGAMNKGGTLNRRGMQVKCPECQARYDRDRATCPECGCKNEKKKSVMKTYGGMKECPECKSMFNKKKSKCPDCGCSNKKSVMKSADELLEELADRIEKAGDNLTLEEIDVIASELVESYDHEDLEDEAELDQGDEGSIIEGSNPTNSQTDNNKEGETMFERNNLDPDVLAYIEGLENELESVGKNDDSTTDENIFKGMSPAAVEIVKSAQAKANAAEEQIAKMQEAADLKFYGDIAKSYNALPTGEDTAAALLALAKADEVAYTEIIRVLNAANELSKANTRLKAVGTSAPAAGSAVEKIEQIATEIAKSENISIAKARATAMERNPELYEGSLSEKVI